MSVTRRTSVRLVPESPGSSSPKPDWRSLSTQAGLDERELRAACRRRRYTRGDTIFHEGDPAGAFHMLDRGWVAVRLTTRLGDVSIIDILQPGDTFGEQALIHGAGQRSASITALERVETLTLDPDGFRELCRGNPAVYEFLLMVLSGRLRETSHQLLEARYVPADQRLFRCLAKLAESFRTATDSAIPLTQADLASMTGITRSTANRLLRRAEEDGLLEISRGRIRVVDPDRLRGRSGPA